MVSIYKKTRLDRLLVDNGLAPTRARAADLIRRGCVSVGGKPQSKLGALVLPDAELAVSPEACAYVSRGALKLEAWLDAFGFDPKGRVAIDVGASTGGFTEVLIARGAASVYAVDVGRGQLHAKLSVNPKVVALDGTDARALDWSVIREAVTAIVADVSFIGLAWHCLSCCRAGGVARGPGQAAMRSRARRGRQRRHRPGRGHAATGRRQGATFYRGGGLYHCRRNRLADSWGQR